MVVYVEASGCTNVCRHCGADGKPPYGALYSLEELRALRKEWGVLCPYYEPTAHPEFPDIMGPEIVEQPGVLATAGFGLARSKDYKKILNRLREFGYGTLSFTLHGLAEHHDWFVARPGALQDIMTAGRRATECGLAVFWNVFLNKQNLEQVPALVELQKSEFNETPYISVPHHRVSRRMWKYEELRPSLDDLQQRLPRNLVQEKWKLPLEQCPLDEFTEATWLRAWENNPGSDDFRHPFEPRTWPVKPPFEHAALYITKDREVCLDPMCAPRVSLGPLSDGKQAILQKLQELPAPKESCLRPEQANLPLAHRDLVHPRAFSVRLKAISSTLYSGGRSR